MADNKDKAGFPTAAGIWLGGRAWLKTGKRDTGKTMQRCCEGVRDEPARFRRSQRHQHTAALASAA